MEDILAGAFAYSNRHSPSKKEHLNQLHVPLDCTNKPIDVEVPVLAIENEVHPLTSDGHQVEVPDINRQDHVKPSKPYDCTTLKSDHRIISNLNNMLQALNYLQAR